MKALVFVAGLACLLAVADVGTTGPVSGPLSTYRKMDPGSKLRFEGAFKGGERACVIAKGDHDPPVKLTITVLEIKKDPATGEKLETLVARDDLGGDLCSVIWYPPRTGRYAVVIASNSGVWNKVWLCIK
jgi:hypothetical protein